MIPLHTSVPSPHDFHLFCAFARPASLSLLTLPLLPELRPRYPASPLEKVANESASQAPVTPVTAAILTSGVSDSASTPTRSPAWPTRRLRWGTCGASIRICARRLLRGGEQAGKWERRKRARQLFFAATPLSKIVCGGLRWSNFFLFGWARGRVHREECAFFFCGMSVQATTAFVY